MQRFSIIVPVLGDRRLLDDTLASVLRYRPDACQVIVVHDGTYEDPYGLDGEVDFVTTPERGQLIRLFNAGLSQATGELVALIRPGVELDESWDQAVEVDFDVPRIGSVTPILVTPAQSTMMVAAGVNKGLGYRRLVVANQKRLAPRNLQHIRPLGPTSWAGFYRRSALDRIGPIDESLDPHYLDLDLALGLASLGYQNALCDECVLTVERAILVNRENELPHGKSAQRAFRRHGQNLSTLELIARTISAFAQEVITSPLQPSKFPHAIQRMGALGAAGADRLFAKRISVAAKKDNVLESSVLRLGKFDSEHTQPETGETGRDRHAA